MDTMTIIYIVVAFVVGAILTSIFKKGSNSTSSDNAKMQELEAENGSLKEKLSSISNESRNKESQLKEKYESLLSEAQKQCDSLDKQLKSAIDGNIDESIKKQLEQVDKLKKQVKDLEEEVEEQEDDISSLKKKLRTKEDDITGLQDSLFKEQSTSKKLNTELESVKQQLDDKVEELNVKIGSLNFIQEILSAKEISTADTNALNKNINFFESFVKGQFTDLNSYLYTTYKLTWNDLEGKAGFEQKKKFFHDAFDQWASTKRKSWLDGKTTIAFVGEFSAGKTSIVNRILSQDNPSIPKLPVSTKATTAIPTYIAGGSSVTYSFIAGDGKRKTILEETFKKVSKDVLDQVKGVSSLIKYFVMTYKNPNLNGLSLLDTPGFNSNDKEDRDRTIDVINECDALFWVFDVNAGTVNRSSISVIKEKLNKPLYVVINKVDTKSDSEVQKVENLIKKTLTDEGLKVEKFIKFSAKAPLTDIMNPIKGVSKIATRDTFVNDVKNDIEKLLNILDDGVKQCNDSYNTAFQEGEDITDEFIECMKAMQEDCGMAYNIPHWETHLFSSDRYEMSEYEGQRLQSLLDKIADDHVGALANKFEERVSKAAEIQQEWSNLCDLKAAWQKVNDCYEQYKKVSKSIN